MGYNSYIQHKEIYYRRSYTHMSLISINCDSGLYYRRSTLFDSRTLLPFGFSLRVSCVLSSPFSFVVTLFNDFKLLQPRSPSHVPFCPQDLNDDRNKGCVRYWNLFYYNVLETPQLKDQPFDTNHRRNGLKNRT